MKKKFKKPLQSGRSWRRARGPRVVVSGCVRAFKEKVRWAPALTLWAGMLGLLLVPHAAARANEGEVPSAFFETHQASAVAFYARRSERPQFMYAVLAAQILHQRGHSARLARLAGETVAEAAATVEIDGTASRAYRRALLRAVLKARPSADRSSVPASAAGIAPRVVGEALVQAFLEVDASAAAATGSDSERDKLRRALSFRFISRRWSDLTREPALRALLDDQMSRATDYVPERATRQSDLLAAHSAYAQDARTGKLLEAQALWVQGPVAPHAVLDFARQCVVDGELEPVLKTLEDVASGRRSIHDWPKPSPDADGASSCSGASDAPSAPTFDKLAARIAHQNRLLDSVGTMLQFTGSHVRSTKARRTLGKIHQGLHIAQSLNHLRNDFAKLENPNGVPVKLLAAATTMDMVSIGLAIVGLFAPGGPSEIEILAQQMHDRFDTVDARLVDLDIKLDVYMNRLSKQLDQVLRLQAESLEQIGQLSAQITSLESVLKRELEAIRGRLDELVRMQSAYNADLRFDIYADRGIRPDEWQAHDALRHIRWTVTDYARQTALLGEDVDRRTFTDPDTILAAVAGLRNRSPSGSVDASIDLWSGIIQKPLQATRCPDLTWVARGVDSYLEFHDRYWDPAWDEPTSTYLDEMLRVARYNAETLRLSREPERWQLLFARQNQLYDQCVAQIEQIAATYRERKMRLSPHEKALVWPFSRESLRSHFQWPRGDAETSAGERGRTNRQVLWRRVGNAVVAMNYLKQMDTIYPPHLHTTDRQQTIAMDGQSGVVNLQFTKEFRQYVNVRRTSDRVQLAPPYLNECLPHSMRALSFLRKSNLDLPLALQWKGRAAWSPRLSFARTWRGGFNPYSLYKFHGTPMIHVRVALETAESEPRFHSVATLVFPEMEQQIFKFSDMWLRVERRDDGVRKRIRDQAHKSIPPPLEQLSDKTNWHDRVSVGSPKRVRRAKVWEANGQAGITEIYETCQQIERRLAERIAAAAADVNVSQAQIVLRLGDEQPRNYRDDLRDLLDELRQNAQLLRAVGRLSEHCIKVFVPDYLLASEQDEVLEAMPRAAHLTAALGDGAGLDAAVLEMRSRRKQWREFQTDFLWYLKDATHPTAAQRLAERTITRLEEATEMQRRAQEAREEARRMLGLLEAR